MGDLPEPLVPPDLDLRDFRWMKLDLIALFNSDFNSTADDTAWRAGVTLWGKAWHQVPAGSLPDDDGRLCNLAGLGRDLKTWHRIKREALHGFQACSDGRLYHRFLCQRAVEAAEERDRYERRRAADRNRKKTGNSDGEPQPDGDNSTGKTESSGGNSQSSSGIPSEKALRGRGSGAPKDSEPRLTSETEAARGPPEKSMNGNPVGRFAPLASPSGPALKAHRKELLRMKLLRFCDATLAGQARSKAIAGLCGTDKDHDEQWWLDHLDGQMRARKWDDTAEQARARG